MGDALFHREGDAYIPTDLGGSPWADDALHGGPPSGLLAYGIERHVDDPELQAVRLTFDLFRAVPNAPLHLHTETVRRGRRIHVAQASLIHEGTEVARATGLLLRRSDAPEGGRNHPVPPGPEGYPTTKGIAHRRDDRDSAPFDTFRPRFPGFHTSIETRWVTGYGVEAPPSVWIRIPMPIIEGVPTTPLMRIAAISDFGNAIGNQSLGISGTKHSYINADITLYLHRDPDGEWICLQGNYRAETAGVGFIDSVWLDKRGRIGTGVQSRLLNPR